MLPGLVVRKDILEDVLLGDVFQVDVRVGVDHMLAVLVRAGDQCMRLAISASASCAGGGQTHLEQTLGNVEDLWMKGTVLAWTIVTRRHHVGEGTLVQHLHQLLHPIEVTLS